MHYNSSIHNRRSIRLKGYDYSQAGLYFITICTQYRACLFGNIEKNVMVLNDAGRMVEKWYHQLPNKFHDIRCHEKIIMPNHFHCIIENTGSRVGANLCVRPSPSTNALPPLNTPSSLNDTPPLNPPPSPNNPSSLTDPSSFKTHHSLNEPTQLDKNSSLNNRPLDDHAKSGEHNLSDEHSIVRANLCVRPSPSTNALPPLNDTPPSNDPSLLNVPSPSNDHQPSDDYAVVRANLCVRPIPPLNDPSLDEHPLDEHKPSGEHTLLGEGAPFPIHGPVREQAEGEHIGSPLRGIVQWFKTMTTNEYIRGVKNLGWCPFDGKLWQRNYYEHIIRNEQSYQIISQYILDNPAKWQTDKFYQP